MSNLINLKKRLLDISINRKLSHLSSCMASIGIIHDIYNIKKEDEKFVLSNGHAALALYVVLEDKYGIDADALYEKSGTHPVRGGYLDCSTGSLGLGLPIAVGMALSDKGKNVYCLISDGESDEGSIWESLRFAHLNKLDNLKIYINMNGFSAYNAVDKAYLTTRLQAFHDGINIVETKTAYDGEGWDRHYYTPTKEDHAKNICRFGL